MNLPEWITRDPDGFIHVTGHRIGLSEFIYFYNEGYSPEMLVGLFPTLDLALAHKVIAFYLEHKPEMDAYRMAVQAELDRQQAASPRIDWATLRERLAALRQQETTATAGK